MMLWFWRELARPLTRLITLSSFIDCRCGLTAHVQHEQSIELALVNIGGDGITVHRDHIVHIRRRVRERLLPQTVWIARPLPGMMVPFVDDARKRNPRTL